MRCRRSAAIPGDEDKARELSRSSIRRRSREDFVAAADFLKKRPDCTGKVGVVGFCYGGGIANMLATRVPDLAAARSRSTAGQPAAADVPKIKVAAADPLCRDATSASTPAGPLTRKR